MPFDEEKATRAVKFIENLQHWKGEWANKPVKLMPWQKQIVRDIFGFVNDDGLRKYRIAYCEVSRKNGKSLLASAIGLYLLFADNEPGAEVFSAAFDRDQAKEVWRSSKKMYERTPELQKRGNLVEYKNKIENEQTDGVYKPLSKESLKQHGKSIHGLLFDEVHTQKSTNMWDTLTTAQGARRQPLTFAITTAGSDRESLCRSLHEYTKKVNSKSIDSEDHYGVIFSADPDEQSFPPHWYEDEHEAHCEDFPGAERWTTDGDVDWTDEEAWYAANPSLEREDGTGFRKFDELKSNAQRAENQRNFRNSFKRLYLNIWTESSSAFIEPEKWDKCVEDYTQPSDKLDGRYQGQCVEDLLPTLNAYGGLDLASKHDMAAFVLCFYLEGQYFYKGWYFTPERAVEKRTQDGRVPYRAWVQDGHLIECPGEVIDLSFIFDIIKDASEHYNIVDIAFDRWGASQITQQLQDLGLDVVEFGQGYKDMSPPTKEFDKIIRQQKLVADNDPVMRWAASNMIVQENPAGDPKPHKRKSEDKIDPAVAFIMALDRAVRHEEGDINTKSVYEDRDLTIL